MVYIPNSLWTWSFMGVSIVQAAIALGFESYIFGKFRTSLMGVTGDQTTTDLTSTIPTYLGLLIFAFIYQLILVYDGLAAKNTIQIIGLVFMNLAILIYTAIQIDQIDEAYKSLLALHFITEDYWPVVKPFLIALPLIVALGTLFLGFIAWKLYGEFAWTIYKQISADLRMKRRYLVYQIYIALLKFDFFLFLGFEIQFLILVHGTKLAERVLTIAAVPITIVILLLAAWCTRRENLAGMIGTIVFYFAALAYFIFKLIRIYASDSKRQVQYSTASKTLTIFAAITILLLLFTILIAIWCTSNFNKGLKAHVNKRSKAAEANQKWAMDDVPIKTGFAGNPGGSRMEID